MAGLLAANGVVMLEHFLQHVTVTNCGFSSFAAMCLHCLVQAHVAHNGGHQHIILQLAALQKLQRANQHNLVAV